MTRAKHIPDALRELDALDGIDQALAHIFAAKQVLEGLSDKDKAEDIGSALITAYKSLTRARSILV